MTNANGCADLDEGVRDRVTTSTTISAAPDLVRRAITSAELIPKWWSVWPSCQVTEIDFDAAPGNAYRISSETRRKEKHFITGTILHSTEKLLALTWQTDSSRGLASTVFVMIAPGTESNSTRLDIDHRNISGAREALLYRRAWRQILAVMKRGIPLLAEGPNAEVEAFLNEHPSCR